MLRITRVRAVPVQNNTLVISIWDLSSIFLAFSQFEPEIVLNLSTISGSNWENAKNIELKSHMLINFKTLLVLVIILRILFLAKMFFLSLSLVFRVILLFTFDLGRNGIDGKNSEAGNMLSTCRMY